MGETIPSRNRSSAPRLRRRVTTDLQLGLEPDDPDPGQWVTRLEQTFGTGETAFAEHLLNQLVDAIHIIDKDPAVTERTVGRGSPTMQIDPAHLPMH
jgi:hypothetical protein